MRPILSLLVILCPFFSFSQTETKNVESDSTHGFFYLDLKSTAFFDNLEFINNIEKGYTLTGFNLEPRLRYALGKRHFISAGVHALYFAGQPGFEKLVPLVTIHSQLNNSISLNIGSIDGTNCHGLPQALFKTEREIINQPETGMQFVVKSRFIDGETWINWERFLFFGDSVQEEFTVGISGNVKVSNSDKFQITIPVYALAVHKGGQIDVSDKQVSTLANVGGGINLSAELGLGRIGVEGLAFGGRDLSPEPHHVYKKGWAIYPQIFYHYRSLWVDVGYWKANSLILTRGQDVFGSVSTVDPYHNSPKRELITANIIYSKELVKGFTLAGKFQLYDVLTESQMDYRFTVILRFNEQFLLGKAK